MTKQERVAVGQRLRQQRNRLGLTREQFAELADIGSGYYGQIEVGTSQMSIDTLMKVARTSRLSMEYILLGEEHGEADLTSLQALLARCTPRELRLAEKVLQLFLLRGDVYGAARRKNGGPPARAALAGVRLFVCRQPYRMKFIMGLRAASGAGSFVSRRTRTIQAMFRPSRAATAIPSSSRAASPGSAPWTTPQ